jgi:hypothetical protein
MLPDRKRFVFSDSPAPRHPKPAPDSSRKGKEKMDSPTDSSRKEKPNAPPSGPIPVPPPRTIPAKFGSTPVSATIDITGWGTPPALPPISTTHNAEDRVSGQEVIDFHPSFLGFPALVEACWLEEKDPSSIPFCVYAYHCYTAWWLRVSHIEFSNTRSRNTPYHRLLTTYDSTLSVPPRVRDYLLTLGNFESNGDLYRLRAPPLTLKEEVAGNRLPGHLTIDHPANVSEFLAQYEYAQRSPLPSAMIQPLAHHAGNHGWRSISHDPPGRIGDWFGSDVIPTPLTHPQLRPPSASDCSRLRDLGWNNIPLIKLGPFNYHQPTCAWASEHIDHAVPVSLLTQSPAGGQVQACISEYTNLSRTDTNYPLTRADAALVADVPPDLSPHELRFALACSFSHRLPQLTPHLYPKEHSQQDRVVTHLLETAPSQLPPFLDRVYRHPRKRTNGYSRTSLLKTKHDTVFAFVSSS